MAASPEPSVNPSHLLKSLRVFVAEAAGPAEAEGGEPAFDTAQGADTGAHGRSEGRELLRSKRATPVGSTAGAAGHLPPMPSSHTSSPADGGEAVGWEEAGCLLWDVAALPDDAAFLLKHGLPAMLPPLLTAAAARERWRALEIGLGTAANLACHDDARRQLVQLQGFPALLLDRLLWVDDVGSLTEACRCASALLAAGLDREVGGREGRHCVPCMFKAVSQHWGSMAKACRQHNARQGAVACRHAQTFSRVARGGTVPPSSPISRPPRPRPRRLGGSLCCERRRWGAWCGLWRIR